ncbi:MAG: valine--tRNA ligase, partial [Hyphomicrobiaceae bacterium]
MLEKTYQPSEIEGRIYARWEAEGCFACGDPERVAAGAKPYSIVIPPPNVTGSLHMGHALNNTLQDILIRFERMRGKDVLWQPGTDHAGIATQMVVERQLMERQEHRREMGREKFVDKIWEWKVESGGTITNQLKRLGASCDWSRERFTMDPDMSKAVLKTFVALYNDGLIYKDKRLVNWDPKLLTAISDLEVEQTETNGHLWHFRYPLVDDPSRFITVATTRPETMLGDTAVAVHPDDERYTALIGKMVRLPIVDREIPIVADDYADPEQGSGAVKITPAHDFNDFEVGKRHDLAMLNILDQHAAIVDGDEADAANIPADLRGLDRAVARKMVVAWFEENELLEKVDDHPHTVPYGDRSRVVIEPWLTDQWYVNAEELAKPAIAAVENGTTTFVPKNWEKTYFEWMRNIQPWCISRQLWWGHQIPAWYGPKKCGDGVLGLTVTTDTDEARQALTLRDLEIFVAETEDEAIKQARDYYGCAVRVIPSAAEMFEQRANEPTMFVWRDEDVLDTWFSSALWPFSTLGWPEETPELARYYPGSVLVTGFDIIFFWVARMMMFGLHFMKDEKGKPEIPFHDVYIHALVRDEDGKKMSKSEGNVIDPVDLIQGIGVDELITKRTTGLRKPETAPQIEKLTRARYPDGFEAYGADALRFTLAVMAAMGRDIKLSVERVAGYRNFGTKLWNASRFAQMNEVVGDPDFDPASAEQTVNRWIAGEVEKTAREVTEALEAYRFNDASGAIYKFTWNIFCDWYVELIKPLLNGTDEAAKVETRAMTAWVLDQILKLLHPFMPFITEELWTNLAEHGAPRETQLMLAAWPELSGLADEAADDEMNWVIRLVTEIRSVRSEMNIPMGTKIPLELIGPGDEVLDRVERHTDTIERLARLDGIMRADAPSDGAAQIVVGETTVALPLAGVLDFGAEIDRLQKDISKQQGEIDKIGKKL